jgi:CDP-paratose 2-epimerase
MKKPNYQNKRMGPGVGPAEAGLSGMKPRSKKAEVLITGGAGFIGACLADRLAAEGRAVRILDNLSREGVERNVRWLLQRHGALIDPLIGDIREEKVLSAALKGVRQVFHFAAQVAVTTSLLDPLVDFETNAKGTLLLLEAMRRQPRPPGIIFSSTNKVYGNLSSFALQQQGTRYEPVQRSIGAHGIAECQPLQFYTPYGCSKGAAEQYVLDYARFMGMAAVVMRMSCIYGHRQLGTEDQGWVAHLYLNALRGRRNVIYGDGCQVRDVLFVDDLLNAFQLAERQIEELSGQAFNIGGGVDHTLSLLELVEKISHHLAHAPRLRFLNWRAGDQRYYVSDTRRFTMATAWRPKISVDDGLERLREWLEELLAEGSYAAALQAS